MIHALIIYGNPIIRLGLRSVLERSRIEIVGESIQQDEIQDLVATRQPDIVILDGNLTWTACSAAEMVCQMRKAGASGIIVLDEVPSEEKLFSFLMGGAAGYEPLTLTSEALVEKILRIVAGEYLITGEVVLPKAFASYKRKQRHFPQETETLPSRPPTRAVQPETVLPSRQQSQELFGVTDREIEVLQCVMRGLSNSEVGKVLRITNQTTKNHMTHLLSKLSVRDRTAAVVTALRLGLINHSDPLPGQQEDVYTRSRTVHPKAEGEQSYALVTSG